MNLCRIIGHRWDDGPACCYAVCSHCGACPDYCHGDSAISGDDDPWHILVFWRTRRWLESMPRRLSERFGPCSHCGGWPRCKDSCVPF